MNLLLITLILILALVAIKLSSKSGLPALLLFIILGLIFSRLGIEFNNFQIADNIASISLMVIMFYGGFGTNWSMGKHVAKEAMILSSLGVFLTAILTGAFSYFILRFPLLESMLLGSVVSSTDYASVSNILVSKNLNLKYGTASLLEIESGSNDPTAYTMTMVFLSLILGKNVNVFLLIFKQVFVGILVGFLVGIIVIKLIKLLNFNEDGLFAVFIAAIMFGTYGLADAFGGNGYLALYLMGIYIGNFEYPGKRDVVFFYDGVTSIVQIALFFLLGLLADFSLLIKALPIGLILMLFMFFIARPLTVFCLMKPFKLKNNQMTLISVAGIRGAAAIAFAIMAVNSGANFSINLFSVVFVICLFSSLIQGVLMPISTKALNMFEENDTVLRTFNYYQDKSGLGFLKTKIIENSKWANKKIKDIEIAFNIIIAKIERGGRTIVPRGNTLIEVGDDIVLGGQAYFDSSGKELIEIKLSGNHKWINKEIKDIKVDPNELIIMLQKPTGQIVVPSGDTKLEENDRIVILKADKPIKK